MRRGTHMFGKTIEELLILTKTYPTPSSKHRESTCVAAFSKAGEIRRIFPVPFRLLEGEHQFTKWEWIQVQHRASNGFLIGKTDSDGAHPIFRLLIRWKKKRNLCPLAVYRTDFML